MTKTDGNQTFASIKLAVWQRIHQKRSAHFVLWLRIVPTGAAPHWLLGGLTALPAFPALLDAGAHARPDRIAARIAWNDGAGENRRSAAHAEMVGLIKALAAGHECRS